MENIIFWPMNSFMKKYFITNVDLLNNALQEACFPPQNYPLNTKNLKALHVQFRRI